MQDKDTQSQSSAVELDSSSISEPTAKKKFKKRDKHEEAMSTILSGAAESMEKLVQVVSHKSTAQTAVEPQDDDWLFCKRLYIKLRNLPDSQQKEMFKLNSESELIRMTYGGACNAQPDAGHQRSFQGYDGGQPSGQYYDGGQYMHL